MPIYGPGRGKYIVPDSEEDVALSMDFNQYVQNQEQERGPIISFGTSGGISGGEALPATVPVLPTTPMPALGKYPEMPTIEEEKIRSYTQKAARAPERTLRRQMRKMVGKYDPNDPRYRYQMEGLLGEFGSALSNVYAQAGKTGRAEYMQEYQTKILGWQTEISRIDKEFQAKMQNYMAQYGQKQTYTPPGSSNSGSRLTGKSPLSPRRKKYWYE